MDPMFVFGMVTGSLATIVLLGGIAAWLLTPFIKEAKRRQSNNTL